MLRLLVPLAALPLVHAAPAPSEGLSSASIRAAHEAWEQGPAAHARWRAARPDLVDADGMLVVAELAMGFEPDDLLACLDRSLPATEAEAWVGTGLVARAQVQLWVPWEDLGLLEGCPGLRRLREPHRPRPRYEFTEGYDAMFRTDWHAEGATGRGVRIAVLDVGFAEHDGLLGEELPDSVETWNVAAWGGSLHGTAVAEVVHDIAPDASLALYQFGTDTEFLEAIQALADSKVQVVNGSVGFDNVWPADGSSPVTQAVDILVREYGKVYVAAAGNENERYRSGALSHAAQGAVAIDGMSPVWIATTGGWAVASFRWTEPMGGAGVDLDLIITDEDGVPCDAAGKGQDLQDGDDDPYEYVSCELAGGWAQAWVVDASGGSADLTGLEGFIYAYAGLESEDATGSRNLPLPGDTHEGISVGAVDLPETGEVAWYSSRGPTEDGLVRPHLVAPAGVSTASYGREPFSGTSAATPHVSGVAALLLDVDRSLEPEALRDQLISMTVDISPRGPDDASGAGFLSPDAVPWSGCHCGQVRAPGRGAWLLVLAGLALLRRRGRSG